jgi:ParB family chromosome partitioning protein
MIRNIPIAKLVASERNVRRASDPAADAELKADIEAHGLLQNLVVTQTRKPRGLFAVEAGGRRLRALQALVAEGRFGPGQEICCLVLDRRDVREVSLAENFQRLAMNPADECLAFRQLLEQGADVEGIARRFGLTTRFVEGRLRLASLAPVVFEALGAGEIGLDVAKAYAVTPDQARQAHVFEEVKRYHGSAHPDTIRRLMTQATAGASDRRARVVGEEAYVAAGGRIERDLFSDEGATRWLDVALLERLATEKLERAAAEAAGQTGLAWVRPTLADWVSASETEGLKRLRAETAPLTEEEQRRLEALDGELQRLSAVLEDEDAGEQAQSEAEARVQAIEAEMEAIADRPPRVPEDRKAQAGTFLLIDETGEPRLHATYYIEADVGDEGAAGSAGAGEGATAGEAAPPDKPSSLSQRLTDELAMQRRDILAACVANDPAMARDLATFLMTDRDPGYSRETGSTLRAPAPSDPVTGFETPAAPAIAALARAEEALDRSWMDGSTPAERFDAFRALPDPARDAWLARAVAGTLEASLNLPGLRSCAFHDHLGQTLDIDTARWWRPTGANYFDRVPRKLALAALAEIGGEALAARHASLRKAELAETCERFFAGECVTEPEVKAAALAWVPDPMRFGTAEAPTTGDPAEAAAQPPEATGPADPLALAA